MKTLISILIVAAFGFFFSSCNDTGSILTAPGQNITDGNKEITFTGSGDGETTAPNGMNYPQRHFVGTGTSSLTNGECTIVLDYWALPNGTSMLGTGKLIAANGNELQAINMVGTWTISGTTISFTCSADIAGGTGQFINAMGTMTFSGTMDAVTRVTHAEWTGTLRHAKQFSGIVSALNNTVTEPPCQTGYLRRYAEGSGNGLHFGNFTILLGHCLSPTTGLILDGTGTIVCPNGDKVVINYTGFITPKTAPYYDVIMMGKIVSGTGRFADAEGPVMSICVGNMTTGEVNGTMSGAMDY